MRTIVPARSSDRSVKRLAVKAAAFLVSLDQTDLLADQASLVVPECLALPASPAARHRSVRRRRHHRAAHAHKARLVSLVQRERADRLDDQANLDDPATTDRPDLQAHRAHLAHPAMLAAMDPRASLDDQRSARLPFPATRDSLESRDHQVCLENLANLAEMARLETPVRRVPQVHLVLQARRASLASQVLRVHQAQRVSAVSVRSTARSMAASSSRMAHEESNLGKPRIKHRCLL